jgi:hypothetical protein
MSQSVQPSLVNVLTGTFRALRKDILDPYRPELHYMRGRGPKWREKHATNAPVNAAARRRAGSWRVSAVAPPAAY